jgi:hypothetical protein
MLIMIMQREYMQCSSSRGVASISVRGQLRLLRPLFEKL